MENQENIEIPGEVKKLLSEGEQILGAVRQSRLKELITPDTVIVTDQRIIWYNPTALGLHKSIQDYRYENIGNFKIHKWILYCTMELKSKFLSEGLTVDNLPKAQMDQISKIVQENIRKANLKPSENKTSTQESEDPLKVLKIRFAKGEITRQEYEEMRELLK
jgi:hypothetical protein